MPIKGLKEHKERLRRLPALAEKAVTAALFAGADLIAGEAGVSITTGAMSGKAHVASKAGEAPNADTHVLDKSIGARKAGKLKARVVATAPYAAAVEKGSDRKAGSRFRSFSEKSKKQGPVRQEFGDSSTAARPFLRPARDKKADEVRDLVVRGLNEALRRSRVAGV